MKRPGWTIVELLVVIGVVGVLVGLTLPAVQQARASADRTACANRLKQVGLALHSYDAAYGRLPPKSRVRYPYPEPDSALGWMALILPQMGHDALYRTAEDACRRDAYPMHNPPHTGLAVGLPDYVCPADGRTGPMTDRWGRTLGFTSYLGVAGFLRSTKVRPWVRGVFGERIGCRLTDIADGTGQTLMAGERPPPDSLQAGWWYPLFSAHGTGHIGPNNYVVIGTYAPYPGDDECETTHRRNFGPGRLDNPCDRYHFWSLHPGGGNWLFADASVRFLAYAADPFVSSLATRDGGEIAAAPE